MPLFIRNILVVNCTMKLVALADLRGGTRDARPLLGVQILSFSCSFQQIIRKIIGLWELAPPPGENPGSAIG